MNNEILNFSFQIVDDKISLYKLINKNGIEANFTNYGATILSLLI
ncbi:MAG: hypothetical protein RIR56_1075, partial [Bacteroidota bacterium]